MSEQDRIGRLVDRFAQAPLIVPSGDDAAVARPGGAVSVTSIDAVVDGVHFTLAAWPAEAVGYKAVAAALSDLAAMGALPGEVYVAAGVPTGFDELHFDELTHGIAAAAEAHGAHVAGGDLVRSGELWLSVTVVGYAASEQQIATRSGAAPGDLVVVTGDLGGAARALELLEQGSDPASDELSKQLRPTPRIAAGAALVAAGASAMIDISDGLAGDAGHIARASGVAIEIELAKLPLAPGITDPLYATTSGEEYELLATIRPEHLEQVSAALTECDTRLSAIGEVSEGNGVRLTGAGGRDVEARGFDHFD